MARKSGRPGSAPSLSDLRNDRAVGPGLNARHYAAAEVRLGRPLTAGERKVDVVEILASLEHGKARLAKAIRAEQQRVAGLAARGRSDAQMRVTPEMTAALNWLHELGKREAKRELTRHGVDARPARTYAAPRTPRIRHLIQRLTGYLPTITVRVRRRSVQLQLAQESHRAILRAASRIPGALDAASQLVSSAYYGGMGDVFAASSDLISGWTYSAVLDGGTCEECAGHDGEHFDTWEDAQGVMPDGGPNPDCDGEGRCRCRLVPEGPTAEDTGA